MAQSLVANGEGRAFARFGFAFDRLTGPAGEVKATPITRHLIIMHAGPPIRAACRCGGYAQERLQIQGDFDVVPAGVEGIWQDASPAEVLCVRFAPSLLHAAAEDFDIDPARVELAPALQMRDPQLEHLVLALAAEHDADYATGRLYTEGLAAALVARLLKTRACVGPSERRGASGLSKRQRMRVIDFIEAHLDEDLSLSRLAEVSGLGISQFKALFRLSVGCPPHVYVTERRVSRAARLIAEGKMAMSEIALEAGFSHQSHMARSMRKIIGLRPSEIRRARN
jgi:AraC family transcriptional regulator